MINIHEAKAKLSEYLEAARQGERVLICRHNRPVAELRAVEEASSGSRDLTALYPGETFTTPEFFEPLSPDELAAWEGGPADAALRVAERTAAYSASRSRRRGRPPRNRK